MLGMLLCTGCVPCPHHEWDWPTIDGTLGVRGKAAAGVRVGLGLNSEHCHEAWTTTDAAGRFHFDSDRHLALLMWYGDKFTALRLCFELPGGARHWDQLTMWGGPPHERLDCAEKAGQGSDGGGATFIVCRQLPH